MIRFWFDHPINRSGRLRSTHVGFRGVFNNISKSGTIQRYFNNQTVVTVICSFSILCKMMAIHHYLLRVPKYERDLHRQLLDGNRYSAAKHLLKSYEENIFKVWRIYSCWIDVRWL
jgi:hypothetical protein